MAIAFLFFNVKVLFYRLLQQTKGLTEASDNKSFLEALETLDENSPVADDLMSTILNAALSKDVMYAAVKEMNEKYTEYFTKNQDSLDANLQRQYIEQHRVDCFIIRIYLCFLKL